MTTFVLVHGSYQGGWIWQRVATRLRSAGHTVFAPTMDGCAERRHQLRPGIDTSTYVAEIADLLFYEDLRDVVLVGTSSGGMVVCGAAERMRHRVARLVLVDALALFNGERTRDIVRRTSPVPPGLAFAPPREDAERGLFADLDPTTRAWVLDRYTVSDVPRPFDARRDQGGCWGGAQNHGINSSMRFCGQPFTRRVRRSVKYACGLT